MKSFKTWLENRNKVWLKENIDDDDWLRTRYDRGDYKDPDLRRSMSSFNKDEENLVMISIDDIENEIHEILISMKFYDFLNVIEKIDPSLLSSETGSLGQHKQNKIIRMLFDKMPESKKRYAALLKYVRKASENPEAIETMRPFRMSIRESWGDDFGDDDYIRRNYNADYTGYPGDESNDLEAVDNFKISKLRQDIEYLLYNTTFTKFKNMVQKIYPDIYIHPTDDRDVVIEELFDRLPYVVSKYETVLRQMRRNLRY